MQGELLKKDEERMRYLDTPPPFLTKYSEAEASRALRFFDKWCPGVADEIQGTVDSLGISITDVAFLGGKSKANGTSAIPIREDSPAKKRASHCSHLAVLPSISEDRHTHVGRNMDFHPADSDLRLCTTRIQGKASHIGFSDMIFGRVDGMNEHGLCVTTSNGPPGGKPEPVIGVPFFVAVRAVLDSCRTVDEALDVIGEMPIAWSTNIIVADRRGEAALIEIAYAQRATKRIGPGTRGQSLCATNHHTLPAMMPYGARRMRHSVVRHRTVVSRLQDAAPGIGGDSIKAILGERMPEGVCCQHYSGWLGTLWSMVFDVTDGHVEICFGAPCSSRNVWRSFGLQGTVGSTEYAAHLPDTPINPGSLSAE
jgi:hypothetical protein